MSEENAPTSPKPPSADRLVLLWRRIGDHKIAQWGVAYVALAYAIQHAVTLTGEAFDWPHEIARISMLLLVLGLPLVMTFAWYHGAKANRHFSQAEMTIIAILLVIGAFLFYVFVRPTEQIAARPATAAQVATAVAPATKSAGISVAVLPFINMSGDPKEEYFSDGMTEEITSALAKIPNLPVVGRTSAFAFKGKNEDLGVIGQALHATYLLEGSVRKAGDRVRITAQLIRVGDDHHVWTDSYDRDLKDVFAVQEDVAKNIAAALQVPLGLKPGENLVVNRTTDTQAYEDYLRALALYRARDIKQVVSVLEPMVRRDKTYAPAWALLAEGYALEPVYVIGLTGPVDDFRRNIGLVLGKAERAAREAIRLDPKYAPGYTAFGFIKADGGHWAEADSNFQKAVELDSTDPDMLQLYSLSLSAMGRNAQSLKLRMTLHALEPFVPIYNVALAEIKQLNGDTSGAISIFEKLPSDGAVGAQRDNYLALAYATRGQYALAAQTLLGVSPDQTNVPQPVAKQAAEIIRKAPAKIIAPEPTLVSSSPVGWVYGFVGAQGRLLDEPERLAMSGFFSAPNVGLIWHPSFSAIRRTERFKAFIREAGLVDYWRVKGWPDLCHPTTGDDFECN